MADSDLDREKDDDADDGGREERVEKTRVHNKTAKRPLSELDDPPERGPAAYVAELIGTFGLVFFVCTVVMIYAPGPIPAAQPGLPETQPFQDWSVIGLVHAFILFALIQTAAVVSGAHFNPAVTVALAAIRQIRTIDAAIYIAVQFVGAILAAWLVKLMFDNPGGLADDDMFGQVAIGPVAGNSTTVAMAAEVIGTFFLVWAIVGIAVNPRGTRDWAGFAIGATLGVAVMVLGPVSGGGFNPARAFGPALIGEFGEGALDWILIWVVAPVLGALLAAFAYFQTIILPGRKGTEGMGPVG